MEETATTRRQIAIAEQFKQLGFDVSAQVMRQDASLQGDVERNVTGGPDAQVVSDAPVAVEITLDFFAQALIQFFTAQRIDCHANLVPTSGPTQRHAGSPLDLAGGTALGQARIVVAGDSAL